MLLGACTSAPQYGAVPGAVRGQDIQPGQQQEVPMTRQEAEEQINAAQEGQIGQNTEVAGKPDVAAEQGAMPPGVGYSNNPGVLYDPAMGQRTYVHHYIHHIYHNGSAPDDGANAAPAPPPSGYRRGAYIVPDNEDPNDRRGGGGNFGAYNLPIQHTYNGPVSHHYYGGANIAGGGYGATPEGSGVPSGFGGDSSTGGATSWGTFGAWHPNNFDGAGSIGGFTD